VVDVLAVILEQLEAMYGDIEPPLSDPYRLIIFENIGYLADDERRQIAFQALEKRVGLAPKKILAASEETLLDIARLGGIHAETRVEKLRTIASLVVDQHGGDLARTLPDDPKLARRALKAFPGIGDPGADKILLFSRRDTAPALESNGLRALARLGFANEKDSYGKQYKTAVAAIAAQIEATVEARIRAFQLLRRHGQELCKRSAPLCESCPLAASCPVGSKDAKASRG
jgi:endonuclease III